MRAIVAEGFGGYESLKPADSPKPAVFDGRVLVRMTAAGVTPLDYTILSGNLPMAKAPLVLGNERASVVELEKAVAKYAAKYGLGKVPRPLYWQGYKIVPLDFEFWAEGAFRLHERIVFRRQSELDAWRQERLYL